MTIIQGSLCEEIIRRRTVFNDNMSLLTIDNDGDFYCPESYHVKTKSNQINVISTAVTYNCKIIFVESGRHTATYIKDLLRFEYGIYPDLICYKFSLGIFDSFCQPNLFEYLKLHQINTLILMGFATDCCVTASILGGNGGITGYYSGLSTYGITVLTTPSILWPYHPNMYPLHTNDARNYCQQTSQMGSLQTNNWPVFSLSPGVRIYTQV